jgi:iron complex outermembrane receptor protein
MSITSEGFINLSFEYRQADAFVRSIQKSDAAALIADGNTAVSNPA